jgi:diacylglycerol kinase family enzyme
MSAGQSFHGEHEPPPAAQRRWAARGALMTAAAALVTPLVIAGVLSLVLLVIAVAGFAIVAAGLWWLLSHRGLVRVAGGFVIVIAVFGVAVIFALADFWWIVAVTVALWLVFGALARIALRGSGAQMAEFHAAPAYRPLLIMNPRSGGGKVARFGLKGKAEALGARVVMLGAGDSDVVALARDAVAEGADLLGVAGGDGTQALVAGVAAEHDVPMLVISAGTRNHFALDLGLDLDDPARCLDALSDGVELRVDLGDANGRPFVNNASFGAYAQIVRSPDYRADKLQTTLRQLPDLLVRETGARLCAEAGPTRIEAPQAVLVSNNPYGTGDPAGLGQRLRLDGGTLGIVGVRVDTSLRAAALWRGTPAPGVTVTTAPEVVVTADATEIPVGVDGESLMMRTPVRCAIRPGVLRVRVPRSRPGRARKVWLDWQVVRGLLGSAIGRPHDTRDDRRAGVEPR